MKAEPNRDVGGRERERREGEGREELPDPTMDR